MYGFNLCCGPDSAVLIKSKESEYFGISYEFWIHGLNLFSVSASDNVDCCRITGFISETDRVFECVNNKEHNKSDAYLYDIVKEIEIQEYPAVRPVLLSNRQ